MSPFKVSIVILQYNNSVDTIRCLYSVFNAQYHNLEAVEIIVVDNASEPEHLQNIRDYMKSQPSQYKVAFLKNSFNLGYSGGNNTGIKYALENGAEYVFILNNDATIEKDTLENLIRAGESDFQIGILSPQIIEGDQTTYGGEVNWLKAELKHIKDPKKDPGYIPGTAMLVRRNVFEKIGLFDTRYFLYFEDADYSMRAKKAGYKLAVIPRSTISHKTSTTTKKLGAPLLLRYHMRNSLLFNLVHTPSSYKTALHIWALWVSTKQVIKILLRIRPQHSKAVLFGITDFYKERWGEIKES